MTTSVLGVIGVARKEGRKGYLVGRLRRCGRIVWFCTSVAVGQSAGKEGGRSVRTPTKRDKLPSKQARREGGKSARILNKSEDKKCKKERWGGKGAVLKS